MASENMNYWQKQRTKSGWGNGLVVWAEDHTAYISVVFSWDLREARRLAILYARQGLAVRAGGPAVTLNPGSICDIAQVGGDLDALNRHNLSATFTSRGCMRQCSFCAVPKLEGDLVELEDWPIKPLICDNNLLACSMAHFDRVIDRLKSIRGIDFNQGLDARLLTKYHANRIAELDLKTIRLAWDHISLESHFMKAWEIFRAAGIAKSKISVYVLIGFNDTPEDALYRLRAIKNLGALPFPMRYQPIDAHARNSYVSPQWTQWELVAYMRYWANLRYLRAVPFSEWLETYRRPEQLKMEFDNLGNS